MAMVWLGAWLMGLRLAGRSEASAGSRSLSLRWERWPDPRLGEEQGSRGPRVQSWLRTRTGRREPVSGEELAVKRGEFLREPGHERARVRGPPLTTPIREMQSRARHWQDDSFIAGSDICAGLLLPIPQRSKQKRDVRRVHACGVCAWVKPAARLGHSRRSNLPRPALPRAQRRLHEAPRTGRPPLLHFVLDPRFLANGLAPGALEFDKIQPDCIWRSAGGCACARGPRSGSRCGWWRCRSLRVVGRRAYSAGSSWASRGAILP